MSSAAIEINTAGSRRASAGVALAIGVLYISGVPFYQADLMSYLFGSILLVPRESVWFMVTLDVLLLLIVVVVYLAVSLSGIRRRSRLHARHTG